MDGFSPQKTKYGRFLEGFDLQIKEAMENSRHVALLPSLRVK